MQPDGTKRTWKWSASGPFLSPWTTNDVRSIKKRELDDHRDGEIARLGAAEYWRQIADLEARLG